MRDHSTDGMAEQRALLVRQRRLATGLLVVMALVFVATRAVPEPGFWTHLLRAATEAAMVGGLADWFAVTALFHHPFGIPIPHTAIVPRNKARIGEGLAGFVERNFLAPDLVAERIRVLKPADMLAHWLLEPGKAEMLAGRAIAGVPFLLHSLQDRELRNFLRGMLSEQIMAVDLAPVLGRLLRILTEANQHQVLFDRALVIARQLLVDHEERIHAMVSERSRWWIPSTIDRKIAGKIIGGAADLLADLAQHDHEARRAFEQAVAELVQQLQHSESHRAAVEDVKQRLLQSDAVQDYLEGVWDELRELILADVKGSDSKLRGALVGALLSLGHSLRDDNAVRERLNRRIERLAMDYVVPWRVEIGRFIADVVRGWDTATVTERIELAVGRDLQFIRINGTLVGALAGCLLFLISEWLLPLVF